jgi:glycosyltransferase involved in cell wall biosynthesis
MSIPVTRETTSLISVIIPVHNGARWLGETLKSVLAQTHRNLEIILVDDASTDELQTVLTENRDARLRVTRLESNIGVSAARNFGVDLSRGEYVAFCDADDICLPQRLAMQLAYLQVHTDLGFCGTAFTCFDTEDRDTVMHPLSHREIREALMEGTCFGLSTVMIRAPLIKKARFDPALRVSEDYDLWCRLVLAGVRAGNLSESLVRYRWHPRQVSRDKAALLDQVTRRVRALYCAKIVGDVLWAHTLAAETIDENDLAMAAQKVAEHVAKHPELPASKLRYMLAWLYQNLPRHGVQQWVLWSRIQARLKLRLDRKYRINIAILALLPAWMTRKHFDTLVKLKG